MDTTPKPIIPPPAPPPAKTMLKSKTLAINIVIILASFVPAVGAWVQANPADTLCLLGAVNIILRLATKSRLALWKE